MPEPSPPRRSSRRLRRGIYLLPSLFTIGNIFLGFFAIVAGVQGRFGRAVIAVFGAAFLDALDGRIARLTGTESDFGKEFDSLADVVTFCVAPALLAYLWGLHAFGRLGWLVPLFFLVCGATRLARFNVQARVVDKRYFVGLPTPAAAGTVGTILLFTPEPDWRPWFTGFLLVTLVLVGILMVSTFRYRSFKQVDLKRRRSYRVAIPVAAFLLLVAWQPRPVLASAALVYTLSGPLAWAVGRLRRGGTPAEGETAEPEEPASEATAMAATEGREP